MLNSKVSINKPKTVKLYFLLWFSKKQLGGQYVRIDNNNYSIIVDNMIIMINTNRLCTSNDT